ncbi:helix-turn-helix transcriptional regulator [Coralliovum pocilloporae]|uniref:helix-turn-helix transcriptional regulator n=1 Tax=Coralliovum pocilloporae TaxID=3066369 RepID=UPI00330725D7
MHSQRPSLPTETLEKWQRVVDLISELARVPATLIMSTAGDSHKVTISSHSAGNPYEPGQSFKLEKNLYCYGVLQKGGELFVEDARCDPDWMDNEDLCKDGMSFYIGYPIRWPDGGIFGTICVLDRKKNEKATLFRRGLQEFCGIVEDDLAMLQEVEQRKQAQTALRQTLESRDATIKSRTHALEDANTALRVLIENVETTKRDAEQTIIRHIKDQILPLVEKLQLLQPDNDTQQTYVEMIRTSLEQITSTLSSEAEQALSCMTPAETEIIQLVRHGRTTKEIARILHREPSTIDFHRNNIRQKLGLNRRQNLRRHLLSLSH